MTKYCLFKPFKKENLTAHNKLQKSQNNDEKHREEGFFLDKLALTLMIIGGLNWGLVGIFGFDLVAWALGGQGSIFARIVYILVALAAIWAIPMLFRRHIIAEEV